MKILNSDQMREIDRRTTEEFGIPSLQLMENAGNRVVEFLEENFAPEVDKTKIAVVCGKGNNGGDGFVVARLLKERGGNPQVYLFAAPETVQGDAAVNLKRWRDAGGELRVLDSPEKWKEARPEFAAVEILVDALFGTGLRGPVEGFLASVIEDLNTLCAKARVLAVDIASGLSSETGEIVGPFMRADATVTFTAPKIAHIFPPATSHTGDFHVAQIGTAAELLQRHERLKLHWIEPSEFIGLNLKRPPEAHKGDFGHALIVAGSRGKTGAAVLAAGGALRSGAGLVTVATPAPVQLAVAVGLPEMMTEGLLPTDADTISPRNLDYGKFFQLLHGKNVLAIGPGISQHPETQQFVREVLAETTLPVILDADGLNAFVGHTDQLRARKCAQLCITPHPGEMARLVGSTTAAVQKDRLGIALRAAADWNAFVILKGHRTILATPDGCAFVNTSGNPGMATGGTGDVLTGILAGLTAQFGTSQWERVLSLGLFLHGLAGDFAVHVTGEASLIAGDLVEALPYVYRTVMTEVAHG
jgi:NAD(P)H-hydrate epimerase